MRRLDREVFVGREEEIAIFRQWVQMETRMPLLLNVTGPPGMGKSSLLRAFRRFAGGLGRPVRLVDGRAIPPTPAALLAALGGSHLADVQRHLSQVGAIVLLDSFEVMTELWEYIRDELLTGLDIGVKVAIAGRQPPSLTWVAESHWHRLIRPLRMHGLSSAESGVYLRRCGLEDPRLIEEVLKATTGYPLLLSLAASLLEATGVRKFGCTPEWRLIVHSVAEQLLSEIEDPRLRSLLTAAAVVGTFDAATLAALAGPDEGADAFARLCNVSLVTPTKSGLTIHHNLRRVLVNDFKWRRPDAYVTLRDWVRTRSAAPSGRELLIGSRPEAVAELPGSGLERQTPRGLPKLRGKQADPVALTPREREVLDVLGRGLTTSREIAAELVISQGTANLHVKRVLRKLGFVSRVELAHWWATQAAAGTSTRKAPRSAS